MFSGACFRIVLAAQFTLVVAAPARPFGRVANPAPAITSLSPAAVQAGAHARILAILGRNFLSTSVVTYNGNPHKVTFSNAGRLTIVLSSSELAAPGSFPVVVVNPPPGGGASDPVTFDVRPRASE